MTAKTCCRLRRTVGAWRSLVAHLSRGQGVGSSNLLAPTIFIQLFKALGFAGPLAFPGHHFSQQKLVLRASLHRKLGDRDECLLVLGFRDA